MGWFVLSWRPAPVGGGGGRGGGGRPLFPFAIVVGPSSFPPPPPTLLRAGGRFDRYKSTFRQKDGRAKFGALNRLQERGDRREARTWIGRVRPSLPGVGVRPWGEIILRWNIPGSIVKLGNTLWPVYLKYSGDFASGLVVGKKVERKLVIVSSPPSLLFPNPPSLSL